MKCITVIIQLFRSMIQFTYRSFVVLGGSVLISDLMLSNYFISKMNSLLGDEFQSFINSYNDDRVQGLRINPLKISIDEFMKINKFSLEKIPWTQYGFYYPSNEHPGKHPYHEAGLYYIQEPSAMLIGELVDPKEGEKVLDLCAAPGGKTTHMASKMKQKGILVSNEINVQRAKILLENVKRMGIKNVVVTNESPDRLALKFNSYFDKILVDAPCSGEGMFRKDPLACDEWSLKRVDMCAKRQMDILEHAKTMLKDGGRLVYSTCTFAPEENEGTIDEFLKRNPSFEIEKTNYVDFFDSGKPEWVSSDNLNLTKTLRLWPHRIKGEGHYAAVLRKNGTGSYTKREYVNTIKENKNLKDYFDFIDKNIVTSIYGEYVLFGEQLYLVNKDLVNLDGLRSLCPGWHLGALKKGRFEPNHAMAMALKKEEIRSAINLNADCEELISYLKGESLNCLGQKGWNLILVDGYSIGWGKYNDGILKNHYPKELRLKFKS